MAGGPISLALRAVNGYRARIAQTTPLACPQTPRKDQCETEFSSEAQGHSEKQVLSGEIVGSVVDDGRPQGLPLLGFGG